MSFVLGFLIVIVISTLAQVVISIVSLPFSLASESIESMELALSLIVGIPTIIALVALQAFQNAFLYGIFTGAYKRLREEPAA